MALRALALAALPAAAAVDLHVGLCAPLTTGWGVKDAMSFFLALEYWRAGPTDLAGGLPKPLSPTAVNVSVSEIDSRCSGQASFESTMVSFSDSRRKPDVIVGCICSAASLAVGRFSTAFRIPMLVTSSQSTDLSIKSDYPYIFRFCATEVADADVHAALLQYFQINKTTVIYIDSARGVKQKDRLLSRPSMKKVDAMVVRLPDVDVSEDEAFQSMVVKLRSVRSSPAFVLVCYLASAYNSAEYLGLVAADRAGLLNNYTMFLFAETMLDELTEGDAAMLPLPIRRKLVGCMKASPKPVAARMRAFKDWVRTVNMSTLLSMGLGPASLVDDQWLADPDALLPAWHALRFDATMGLLATVHELHSSGQPVDSTSISSKMEGLELAGIMGDLTWDATQDREGLVYEISQLQHEDDEATLPPTLVPVGELVLDGVTPASLQEHLLSFQGTPPRKRLVYPEAPACPDGMFKPDAFSMPSECAPCPRGTHSTAHFAGACVPCQAGLHGNLEGQSRCKSCPPGAFTSTPGSLSCELCPPGKAVEAAGATACQHCSPGRASSQPGVSSCAWCGLGSYQPRDNSSECLPCRDVLQGSSTSLPGAERSDQCICPAGFYKPLGNAIRCHSCPVGLTCRDGSAEEHFRQFRGAANITCQSAPCAFPVPKPGFFVTAEAPMSVYRCIAEIDCPGGAAEMCDVGRDGIACGMCQPGRYGNAGTPCKVCSDVTRSNFLFPVLPIILVPFLVLAMHRLGQDPICKWGSAGNSTVVVLYTFVVYLQSLTTLRSCYLDTPESHSEGLSWSSGSLDFISLLRPECASLYNFRTRFTVNLLLPIYMLVIFVAVYVVCKLLKRFVSSLPQMLVLDRDIVFNCYGSLFFTFYIGITSQSLSLFQCYLHPNEQRSMRSAPQIICYSGEWMQLLAAAVVAVILFCVGPLGLILQVLYVTPDRFNDLTFRKRWKFLFVKFRTTGYAWSMVILAKGIAMNMTTIIFDTGVKQILWLTGVFEAYLLATFVWRPWRSLLAQLNDIIQHGALIFILSIMPYFTALVDVSQDSLAIVALIVAIFPMFTVAAAASFLTYLRVCGARALPEGLRWTNGARSHAMELFKLSPNLRASMTDEEMWTKLEAIPYSDVLTLNAAERILRREHTRLTKFAGLPKGMIPRTSTIHSVRTLLKGSVRSDSSMASVTPSERSTSVCDPAPEVSEEGSAKGESAVPVDEFQVLNMTYFAV